MATIKTNTSSVTDTSAGIIRYNDTSDITGGKTLKRSESYLTPELRAYKSMYGDPLSLCFKFMIDYDKPYGLFAPADCVDSALAYVARIEQDGVESVRFQALLNWIDNFKMMVQYYDFLMLEIEGLEQILNVKPETSFNDTENRIQLKFRETVDMRIQNLVDGYRHIIYDDNRMVEVIPINLRRFDCHVLLYPTGYYNMALYSLTGGKEEVLNGEGEKTEKDLDEGTIRKVLPTIDKLDSSSMIDWNISSFNNMCFNMMDCQFIVEESGKDLFGTISNEMSGEFAKNNICFGYHFADYKGIFNNTRGEIDLMNALAMSAAQDRAASSVAVSNAPSSEKSTTKKPPVATDAQIKAAFAKEKQRRADVKAQRKADRKAGRKTQTNQYFKNVGEDLKSKGNEICKDVNSVNIFKDIKGKVLSKSFGIGNAFSKVTDAGFIGNMVKNTIDLGISKVEDKYINGTLTKLNNLIGMNFSDNLYSIYKNYFDDKVQNNTGNAALGVMEQEIKQQSESTTTQFQSGTKTQVDNGIKVIGHENIYTRKGF